jgi:antitoxin PrlF
MNMNIRAKVTSKGQITLPKKLRDRLGVKAGDVVEFAENPNGKLELTKPTTTSFQSLRGIVTLDGPPLTPDDIVALVRQARDDRAHELFRRMPASMQKKVMRMRMGEKVK